MAAPHAVGVAALIISHYGRVDSNDPDGLTMDPAQVEQVLTVRARNQACPAAGTLRYPGLPAEYTAVCSGRADRNGFYVAGIADAWRAITVDNRPWPTRLLAEEIGPPDRAP